MMNTSPNNTINSGLLPPRMRYFDIARGIAMICIILGHLSIRGINRVVFTFHVPIFFLISGYFINAQSSFFDFVKKKLHTLIVPYYVTCLAIIVFSVVLNKLIFHGGSSKQIAMGWLWASLYGAGDNYTEPFQVKAIGAIWFLWATFWASLFLRLTLRLKPGHRLFTVIVLFAIGYWSRKLFWFPLSIQAGCCATAYMYLGYLCRLALPRLRELPMEVKAVWTVISLLVWFSFIHDFRSFWLVHCDFGRGVIDFFGSLCACYAIILLSHWIEKSAPTFITHSLSYIGKYSLFILCAHIVELNLFHWILLFNRITACGYSSALAYAVIIVCKLLWAVGLTILCSKWKLIRRLFGMQPNII